MISSSYLSQMWIFSQIQLFVPWIQKVFSYFVLRSGCCDQAVVIIGWFGVFGMRVRRRSAVSALCSDILIHCVGLQEKKRKSNISWFHKHRCWVYKSFSLTSVTAACSVPTGGSEKHISTVFILQLGTQSVTQRDRKPLMPTFMLTRMIRDCNSTEYSNSIHQFVQFRFAEGPECIPATTGWRRGAPCTGRQPVGGITCKLCTGRPDGGFEHSLQHAKRCLTKCSLFCENRKFDECACQCFRLSHPLV